MANEVKLATLVEECYRECEPGRLKEIILKLAEQVYTLGAQSRNGEIYKLETRPRIKPEKEVEQDLCIQEAKRWVISAQESLRDWARDTKLPVGFQSDLGYKLGRALQELEEKGDKN